MPAARVIAFYLPQFHPIPENDAWWGPGFTEWTNVAKARPLFAGHVQPKVPADLGFYDLRLPETRADQARLARDCGVEAFCYWHYWFGGGRRILERPFAEVLASGEPDFPFCLAWANQSWSGIWHGNPGTTLIRQEYPGPEDEVAHFRWALEAFRDPRYLRVDDKPLFVVYAPADLPSTRSFVDHWRRLAKEAGLAGIYFVAISYVHEPDGDLYRDPLYEPFDAVTPLVPQDYLETVGRRPRRRSLSTRIRELTSEKIKDRLLNGRRPEPRRFDYADVVDHAFDGMPDEPRFLPSVLPNWDNTPRSNTRGVVYENSTPQQFRRYLDKAIDRVRGRPQQTSIVFLKAWNEWAEGNYVEPDLRHGHQYLDAIRDAVLGPERGRAPGASDLTIRSAG